MKGIYWFRKAVQEHLQAAGGRREEKFSLDARNPDEAPRRHTKARAEVDERT